MNKFAERLKNLREETGISQSQLARETKLSQAAISLWEDGKRQPNAEAITTLALYFKITSDYLLGLSD